MQDAGNPQRPVLARLVLLRGMNQGPVVVSIQRMASDIPTAPDLSLWNLWRRRRELFAGIGYTTVVTFGLMTSWGLSTFLWALIDESPIHAAQGAAFFYASMMLHQLPTVPLITVAVNLAPRTGAKRILYLLAAWFLVWAFCTFLFHLHGDNPGFNSQYALMVAMIVAACSYRSTARTASSALLQHQIDGAALDSDIKRARLDLLRAQVEPHFLFNTLATVRTLARIDCTAAADMIDNLMRYLSEALPKLQQDESTLAEEMQLIEAYLRIHQIRMGARLSYQLKLPEQLRAERIPTMMLLTLVENAVKHGINPAIDGGYIHVTASRESAALVLRVVDSGRGMVATEGHGTGLANIRRRLTMLYGDAATLSLARPPASGVEATVSIPLRRAS